VSVQGLAVPLEDTQHRDAFDFLVQMADQIDRSTIIIVRYEAEFLVKKLDILETSEFF
jgi:hypothetical protein